MSDLTPITREEQFLDGNTELTPVTRQEMFIKKIYDASQEVPTPITREEMFLKKAADTVHGIEVESLRVTENGTYTAPAGKAYTPVNVNVPLPANAYLLTTITDGDLTSAKSKPLPSVSVAVTDADELDVFVGDSESVTTDNEPYIYRQSKGGRMVSEKLVGASVAWNQLIPIGVSDKSKSENGATIIDNRDGSYTVSTTAEGATATTMLTVVSISGGVIQGHKYCYYGFGENQSALYYYLADGKNSPAALNFGRKNSGIIPATSDGFLDIRIVVSNGSIVSTPVTVNPIIHDLTLMFGSTIADYVYSLEQSTAGSGIAWLKSYGFFSEDYYAYDSGSLKSVQVSEKKVRDASDNVIATYPLPSSDLRGLYKLSSNKLYCDGDIQYGDGWRLRRYGIVDLGTLSWFKQADNIFRVNIESRKYAAGLFPILCQKYVTYTGENSTLSNIGSLVSANGNGIYVNGDSETIFIADSAYNDATTFKTAMSGVYLIYELATPTWEKTHPFTNPQTVGSTEEFVANLPVGHESKYYDGDIHHSYIYSGDARVKVTGDVDIVNGTAPNATCSVCVVMPDGDEIWSDAGDVTAEIWT